MQYKGYTAKVEFDHAAGVLFGEVEGLKDVVTFEATDVEGVARAFRESVDDYLEMCAKRKESAEKPYSGKFLLRVEPGLHREIAIAAASAGKSLNAFAADLIKDWVARSRNPRPQPSGVNASNVANATADRTIAPFVTSESPRVVAENLPEHERLRFGYGHRRTPNTPPQTPSSHLADAA